MSIIADRVCADPEDGIVVFLIGIRINRFLRPRQWLPAFLAMPRMLNELQADPALGLLAARGHFGLRNHMVVQYWRSHAHLQAYAHAPDRAHRPAWTAFMKSVGTGGDVGIWHETYVVAPGQTESIYVNMPRYGLGQAVTPVPARGRRGTAAGRLAQAG